MGQRERPGDRQGEGRDEALRRPPAGGFNTNSGGGFFNKPTPGGVQGFNVPDPNAIGRFDPSGRPTNLRDTGTVRTPVMGGQEGGGVSTAQRRFAEYQRQMLGEELWKLVTLPGQTGPLTTAQAQLALQKQAAGTYGQEVDFFNRMDENFATENRFYGAMGGLLDEQIASAGATTDRQLSQSREQNALATRQGLQNLRTNPVAGGLDEEMFRGQMSMQGRGAETQIAMQGEQLRQAALMDASQKAGQAAQARDTNLANAAQWLFPNQPGTIPLDILTTPQPEDVEHGYPGSPKEGVPDMGHQGIWDRNDTRSLVQDPVTGEWHSGMNDLFDGVLPQGNDAWTPGSESWNGSERQDVMNFLHQFSDDPDMQSALIDQVRVIMDNHPGIGPLQLRQLLHDFGVNQGF